VFALSSAERAARILKVLKDEEWRALLGLERASMSYGYADAGMLSRLSKLPMDRTRFALDKLNKKGLVMGRQSNFVLTRAAVEALAMRDYVKRDIVVALGAIIGKGKESDVYEALSEEGTRYALKFYKMGRTSFTRFRRSRTMDRSEIRSWITTNYEAALREYHALRTLEGLSPSFPKAVSYSRSTVLLQQLTGVRLLERPELDNPESVLREIMAAVRVAFNADLVNADLSEYNILTDGSRVWLIDWPQAVSRSHPNSKELLRRDVSSVLKFFKRAYGVEADVDKEVRAVTRANC
jgi:RIO kinase 2